MKKIHLLILVGLTFLLSCNVHFEKRLYRKGYHVDIITKNKRKPINTAELSINKNILTSTPLLSPESIIPNPLVVSAPEEILEITNTNEFQREKNAVVQKKESKSKVNKSSITPDNKSNSSNLITDTLKQVQVQNKNERGDLMLYLSVALIAVASITAMKIRPKKVLNIARWAKANPTKNKWLIAALQVPMVFLTVMSGYNLRQLGYELSDTFLYVSGGLILLGLLSTPFRPKRIPFTMPANLNRRRMIFLGTILASAMMAVGVGNKMEEQFPNSPVVSIVKSIDQAVFADSHEKPSHTSTPTTKTCKCKTSRKIAGVAGAISCGLVAFYTFLLICFGIGGSIALIVVGAIYAYLTWWPLILLGVVILALVVWALYALFKEPCRKREKKEKVKKVT